MWVFELRKLGEYIKLLYLCWGSCVNVTLALLRSFILGLPLLVATLIF
jgi:hypothetical protein